MTRSPPGTTGGRAIRSPTRNGSRTRTRTKSPDVVPANGNDGQFVRIVRLDQGVRPQPLWLVKQDFEWVGYLEASIGQFRPLGRTRTDYALRDGMKAINNNSSWNNVVRHPVTCENIAESRRPEDDVPQGEDPTLT